MSPELKCGKPPSFLPPASIPFCTVAPMIRIQRVVSVVSLLWFAPAVWAQPVSVSPEVLEQDWGEEVHCYAGAPKKEGLRLLHTAGYTVGYDSNRRLPAWVAYPLSVNQVATETTKRPSRFSSDTRVGNPVRHDDYTHSGFDRGHMAPNMANVLILFANVFILKATINPNIITGGVTTKQKDKVNNKAL